MNKINFNYKTINFLRSESTKVNNQSELNQAIREIKEKLDDGLEVLVLMDNKPKVIRKYQNTIEIVNVEETGKVSSKIIGFLLFLIFGVGLYFFYNY